MPPHLSVVTPVYGAQECIHELCSRLHRSISSITQDYEIILVEDRSPDNSWELILQESEQDPRLRGIRLSKNFGQHKAITAGLDLAQGEWVVVMDCDLQDAPEHIPALYETALQGNHIVIAQFEERVEASLRQIISRHFWKALSYFAGITFDSRVGNFRIMSQKVIANFRSYREQLRLLGGITNLMGFTTAFVSLKRDARHAGKSSYTLKKLLSLAMDITMAYSDKPLKISLFIGTLLSGISLLVGMLIFLLAIANIIEVPGWASVMVSIYFMGGVSLANLGLIGYYVGKTFDQTKNRPIYVIESDTHESVGHSNTHDQHAFPSVLWITGLSSSGKTTIGKKIIKYNEAHGQKSIFLDGDELREVFAATVINNANHGREARLNLAMQYSRLCKTLSQQGFKIVISTISLFKEVHQWNRHNINDYFEVYLKVPLEELKRRDPKGLYKAFDDGKIDNIAGLDLDIDEPQAPDLTLVHSPEVSADMQFEKLLKHLSERVHS